ncbi:phosphoenolpyruvate carboxylase [uncultured Hyphomicrobium sp.]|jgi:phosphoenolpyruvate carboxylase|uniref:phosphoenolpyruvate carboxylase n=1 Tax=uncultured Hyphomicrobium sp. TaxID=194373 RepID=UPI0025DFA802|nr:phosphoenolpyruvate carboxylase [uncultured Hyphomicrobium sp.]
MSSKNQTSGGSKLDEMSLRAELKGLRAQIPDQPTLNPIVSVAFNLSRRLENGEISIDDISELSTRLMDSACVHRAVLLKDQIGVDNEAATRKEFSDFIKTYCAGKDDRAFDAFKSRFSRARNGIVFTAHPTFGISEALSNRMAEIAVSGSAEGQTIGLPHRPDAPLTLEYEHARAQSAVRNLRDAYCDILSDFFHTAHEAFGDKALYSNPQLATFASWVGYDLDGRTDIKWTFSFLLRLREKIAALSDIRERVQALRPQLGEEAEMVRLVRQITGKLDLAVAASESHLKALEAVGKNGFTLAHAANVITQGDGHNLTSTEPLLALLEQITQATSSLESKVAVASIAGLLRATGLGMSHIHVRVNAVQINNAFRAFVHESWTRDLTERQALARIVEMIRTVKPEKVNFETLDLENATAIRQFALVSQISKHIDSETPIRYLIAECETPGTILIALYFAKLFGVSEIVDISPLFETPAALETGQRLVERLLAEEAYRDYVTKRGRLAVQTGYSDAGRFIGQIAAGLAHERLHHGLAEVVRKSGIKNVETLIFSTHGESMGRGAHPGTLRRRLRYVFPGESRWRFFRDGLPVKHETSFQGGDGYLYFANRAFAQRALATIIMSGKDPGSGEDPFYTDTNLALDFQIRLRDYQQELFAHPGYRALLGAFGANLLFKTGSRPVKRQGDHHSDRGDPARMRAIPNNAILQQFGYVANVVAGLGSAVGSERERFVEMAKKSSRLRPLIEMIARGKRLSSLNAVGVNAIVFDAGFWAQRASWAREAHLDGAFKFLAERLLDDDRAQKINGLAHYLRLDAIELHGILEEIGVEGGKIPDDHRMELDLLQAIRAALIMRIFILTAQLPRFTPTNEVTHEEIIGKALSLEIPEVVSVVRQAFPRRVDDPHDDGQFTEKASYLPKGIDDYGRIETEILEPMERAYELVREIGTGISHHWGAFG